jgi:hypothetical protein
MRFENSILENGDWFPLLGKTKNKTLRSDSFHHLRLLADYMSEWAAKNLKGGHVCQKKLLRDGPKSEEQTLRHNTGGQMKTGIKKAITTILLGHRLLEQFESSHEFCAKISAGKGFMPLIREECR